MTRVVMYSFWGRRPNIALQLPFIRRILDEHPEVEFHAFNLARTRSDYFYVKSVAGERITVHNQSYRTRPRWLGYKQVYEFFTQPEYRDCVQIKLDDDIVFAHTDRFDDFVAAIQANPGTVVSADVVNNGACARRRAALWRQFKATGTPLLDWHLHNWTAEAAHEYFFANWREMLSAPTDLIATRDWLSINMVGYDWETCCEFTPRIGEHSPLLIAGREFNDSDRLGDEGAMNCLPRVIAKGVVAAHLAFGPQDPSLKQLIAWRDTYRRIGETYLSHNVSNPEEEHAAV